MSEDSGEAIRPDSRVLHGGGALLANKRLIIEQVTFGALLRGYKMREKWSRVARECGIQRGRERVDVCCCVVLYSWVELDGM